MKRLKWTLTYDQENRKKVSEYVQGQLMQNLEGLNVVLNIQPFKNKLKLAGQGAFDLELASWGLDYADPMTFLDMYLTGGGMNFAAIVTKNTMNWCLAQRWVSLQKTQLNVGKLSKRLKEF